MGVEAPIVPTLILLILAIIAFPTRYNPEDHTEE